jgi:hypothetical protein
MSIPAVDLPAGIVQATLFRSNGTVVAERLFFIEESAPVRAACTFDKKIYNTREKVTFQLHTVDNGVGLPAKASVRVYQTNLFPQQNTMPARHPLYLAGELPFADDPFYITASAEHFDNFLVTQPWKLFQWEEVWNESKKDQYIVQTGLSFSGRAYLKSSQAAIPDSTRISFFLYHDLIVYTTYPGADGKFRFTLYNDFEGDDVVSYRPELKGAALADVVVSLDQAVDERVQHQGVLTAQTIDKSPYAEFLKTKRTIDQAYGMMQRAVGYTYTKVNPHAFLEEEIFGANTVVNLRDYVQFPTMEETLREIVPFVQHRWRNERHTVRVFISDSQQLGKESPLYIIDGVLTDDTDYFMSLNPADVATIKVIHSLSKLGYFGPVGKSGVILVETTIPDNAKNVPVSSRTMPVKGVTRAKDVPDFSGQRMEGRQPRFGACIYWNPEVTTDEHGNATVSFYTPDNAAEFTVEIDGMTYTRKPLHYSSTFEVAFKRQVP